MKHIDTKTSIFLVLTFTFTTGCSESALTGSASAKKEKNKQSDTKKADEPILSDSENINSEGGNVDATNDPTTCVFSVSGAFFAYSGNYYSTVFPATTSGKPVAHGETFDTVGGIYLAARDEPYVYKKGAGELDKAVDNSFDSIAVAPGMTVEIKNSSGTAITPGGTPVTGPFMALSNSYNMSRAVVAAELRKRESVMPPWMVKYLRSINYTFTELSLHSGTEVKVSKIPNVRCNDY